jgi:hypothetical protein
VFAATPVFEIWTSHLEHVFDDTAELRLTRRYGLRMTAKPNTRSDTLVTTGFAAGGGALTPTLVDACTSTTHWTLYAGYTNPTPVPVLASAGGQVTNTLGPSGGSGPSGQIIMSLTRTNLVTIGANDTLMIQATVTGSSGLPGCRAGWRAASLRRSP